MNRKRNNVLPFFLVFSFTFFVLSFILVSHYKDYHYLNNKALYTKIQGRIKGVTLIEEQRRSHFISPYYYSDDDDDSSAFISLTFLCLDMWSYYHTNYKIRLVYEYDYMGKTYVSYVTKKMDETSAVNYNLKYSENQIVPVHVYQSNGAISYLLDNIRSTNIKY